MSESIIETSDATFAQDVLSASLPVIVDFWAPWCQPCLQIAPVIEELARIYAGKMLFVKMNTDNHSLISTHYGIQGLPMLIFFHHGAVVDELPGARPRQDITQHIDQVLSLIATLHT